MRFVKTAESIFDIPSGFTRIEYIQSTGTQYIDTGYIPKTTSSYKCGFELTSIATTSGNWFCVFGSVESNNVIFTELFLPRASGGGDVNQLLVGNHNSTYIRKDYAWAINTPYDFEMTTTDISINGVSQGSITVDSSVTCSHSVYLFARHESNDTVRYNVKAKVRSFKVYEDNTLVRDMIPCIDPFGVPCMYDLVGKKAYYNQGTGEFTVGRQIIPVEYIETDGTSYINTGYTPSGSTETEITTMLKDQTYSRFMFGCRRGQQNNTYACLSHSLNRIGYRVGTGGYLYSSGYNELNVKHTYKIANGVFYRDDVVVDATCEGATDSPNSPLALLTINTNNVLDASQSFVGNLYSCTVKENNTLVRDFIPCKDENNVGFMFDTVSGTVYENAGTGAFIVGNNKYKMKLRLIKDNILPTGYTQLEYIETDNTGGSVCWAAVNYRLTDTTDWEITFSAENIGNNWVIGQPAWVGVHYRKDSSTSNLPRVGIVNGSVSPNQCYVDYTNNEKITLALKGTDVYANGVKAGSITRVSAPAKQTQLGLFAYKADGQDLPNLRLQHGRIYDLKIWDNDTLILHLIPAKNKEGVAGFYETVGKVFIEKESNCTIDFETGKPVLPIVRFPVDPIPVGYKTVNYIEGTGTQYIDTGCKIDAGSKLSLDYQMTDITSGTNGIFGASGTQTLQFLTQTGQANYVFQWTPNSIMYIGTKDTDRHTVILDIPNTNLTVDSDTLSMSSFTFSYPTGNIMLFANGHLSVKGRMKMYNCQIYDNNTLVRNFIPVVRLVDNKAGMWDTVTKQFYTTPVGDFITG